MDSELKEEFAFHFDQLVQENIDAGMEPDDARRAARIALGNISILEEECRDHRGVGFAQDIWKDVGYSVRMLRKSPGFTATAVLSLALGIGANVAIISQIAATIYGALPYTAPERLVLIRSYQPQNPSSLNQTSLSDFYVLRKQSRSFESMGVSLADQKDLTENDASRPPEHLFGRGWSSELIPTLDTQPEFGRLFDASDYLPNVPPSVVVISHRLWQRRFGGDVSILNKRVLMNGVDTRIIGVLPPYFPSTEERVDYWLPMNLARPPNNNRFFMLTARLKNGVTIDQAQSEMDQIAFQLEKDFPDTDKGWAIQVQPLREFLYSWAKPTLLTLEAAVALLLLIASANVAGLLLARGTARGPEIAARIALGAGRPRIIRQHLTETVILALIGGICGLPVCWWGLSALGGMTPQPGVPHLPPVAMTFSVAAVEIAVSLLTGFGFGFVPALVLFRRGSMSLPGNGLRSTPEREAERTRSALIIVQFAIAFVLLAGFGLILRSFVLLANHDLNFVSRGLLSIEFRLPAETYLRYLGRDGERPLYAIDPDPASTFTRILNRLRQLHGVVSVAGSCSPPVNSLIVPSANVIAGSEKQPLHTSYFMITPNFFSTLQSPTLRGREFDDRDTKSATWVAIVNETAARRLWPGEDPIGRQLTFAGIPEERPREVVGLMRDIPTRSRQTVAEPVIYVPYLQHPLKQNGYSNLYGGMTFLLRAPGNPMSLAPAVRQAVAEIEPERALGTVANVDGFIWARLGDFSAYAGVLGIFAIIATLLATIGVYGIISYSVAQRTREIAVRVALGATSAKIFALVGRRAACLICIGIICGFVGALELGRLIEGQLWGIGPADGVTFTLVAVLLCTVAALACFVPARRAVEVNPAVALRRDA
jgi:putative ABC transport system permease protein